MAAGVPNAVRPIVTVTAADVDVHAVGRMDCADTAALMGGSVSSAVGGLGVSGQAKGEDAPRPKQHELSHGISSGDRL
jgi:hypothetical protein